MKRTLSGLTVAAAILASGAIGAACTVTPTAAWTNGDTIAVSTLNEELSALSGTAAGQCLLELQNPQLVNYSGVGIGGPGTYATAFAGSVLSNQIGNLLAVQFAARHGVTVDNAALATAEGDYAALLDGEISANLQQTSSVGSASACQNPDGSALTGAQLLAGLPPSVRTAQIRNQAVDDALLARGADLSDRAVLAYYEANPSQFTVDCVSVIATDTQTHADQLVTRLQQGASFAAVARTDSLDTQTAPNGGQLGCSFTQSRVEQALQLTSVPVGRPIAPVQASSGQWLIYEVTNQSVQPVTAVAGTIRQELLRANANVARVSTELVGFARRSDISVNPQYGTWAGLHIAPPRTPPERFLLPAQLPAVHAAAGIGQG